MAMLTTGNTFCLYIALGLYVAAAMLKHFKLSRLGFGLLLLGFFVNSAYLLGRGWLAGTFIPNPIFEGPFFIPWCMALAAGISKRRGGDAEWGALVLGTVAFSVLTALYPQGMVRPSPKTNSPWVLAFFASEGMALAFFYCGAVVAGFDLLRRQTDCTRFHHYLVWGFVLYSLAQVVGAYWCFLGWGNTFRWSPRHLNSAGIWMLYAAYLHLKFIPGWRAPRKAMFALATGIITLCITLPGYLHEMTLNRIGA